MQLIWNIEGYRHLHHLHSTPLPFGTSLSSRQMPHMGSSMLGVQGQPQGKVSHFSSKYRKKRSMRVWGGLLDKEESVCNMKRKRETIHERDRESGVERKRVYL